MATTNVTQVALYYYYVPVQAGSEAHPASYKMGIRSLSQG